MEPQAQSTGENEAAQQRQASRPRALRQQHFGREGLPLYSSSRVSSGPSNVLNASPLSCLVAAAKAAEDWHDLASSLENVDPAYCSVKPTAKQAGASVQLRSLFASLHELKGQIESLSTVSLPGVLAHFIQIILSSWCIERKDPKFRDHEIDLEPISRHCSDLPTSFHAFLFSKGYRDEDLTRWASVLLAKDLKTSISRLDIHSRNNAPGRKAPLFLILFILRRDYIDSGSLKRLISHIRSHFDHDQSPGFAPRGGIESGKQAIANPVIDGSTAMVIFARLLRHARRVAPECLVDIAHFFCTHVGPVGNLGTTTARRKIGRLTSFYNRALSLLSLPSSTRPFASSSYRQKAQFMLVERMTQFKPPLLITREGYHGVAKVQLTQKMTSREHEWASMKSRSWPPWKEERLGIDAERRIEDGISRTNYAIRRMHEGGYGSYGWEKAANLLAGWDTDGSPAIQVRSVAPRPTATGAYQHSEKAAHHDLPHQSLAGPDSQIWAARIRATRTVREAWACFLSMQDEIPQPPEDAFYAMFEKLIYRKLRAGRERLKQHVTSLYDKRIVVSNDVKEVLPEPESPPEVTYVRSKPPSVRALFDRMIEAQVVPTEKCLALLVRYAGSIKQGVSFLKRSMAVPQDSVNALISYQAMARPISTDSTFDGIPIRVLTAFVQLLCRCSRTPTSLLPNSSGRGENKVTAETNPRHRLKSRGSLGHAIAIMQAWQPTYLPPWNALLAAIAAPKIVIRQGSRSYDRDFQHLSAFQEIKVTLDLMEPNIKLDSEGFCYVCRAFEKAILASRRLQIEERKVFHLIDDRPLRPLPMTSPLISEASRVLKVAPVLVKSLFESLTGSQGLHTQDELAEVEIVGVQERKRSGLPQMLSSVVQPPHLHAYIRVLGQLNDERALLELGEWMAHFSRDLEAMAREREQGQRHLRHSIVALRVFFEIATQKRIHTHNLPSVLDDDEDEAGRTEEPAVLFTDERMKRLIESVPGLGGWPTDSEIKEYLHGGRR